MIYPVSCQARSRRRAVTEQPSSVVVWAAWHLRRHLPWGRILRLALRPILRAWMRQEYNRRPNTT